MSAKLRILLRSVGLVCCLWTWPVATFAAESRVIYRCEENGVPTFSDHACGDSMEVHESAVATNTYEAPRAQSQPRSYDAPHPKAKTTKMQVSPKQREDSCARLERSLKDIRSKMRAGYSAAQGERLKERQTKLRAQHRQARCS